MTAAQRDEMRSKRVDDRLRAMDMKEERRHAEAMRRREEKKNRKKGVDTGKAVRADKALNFKGTGYLVEVTIETTNPEGPAYIPKLCKKMKAAVPGVRHCDYWYADRETHWVHKQTHGREMAERRGAAAEAFEKKVYTVAVIQWVYAPGARD